MANTLQVDGLARITGLTQALHRRILNHRNNHPICLNITLQAVFLATRMMLEHHIFKISVNSSPVVSQVTTLTRSRARRLSMYHFFGIRALSHFSRTEFVGLSSANLILVHQSAIKIDLQKWSSIFKYFLPRAICSNWHQRKNLFAKLTSIIFLHSLLRKSAVVLFNIWELQIYLSGSPCTRRSS